MATKRERETSTCRLLPLCNLCHTLCLCMSPDKPGRPGKPEVTDSDKDHITIKWEPPRKDGGAPITGYNVERKDPRTGKWVKVTREPIEVST